MREAFSKFLMEEAGKNDKLIVLTGDHGNALFKDFRNKYPDKFINIGIAEQNMISVAAGLAKEGFIPIVYALASFVPMRCLEQIKVDICYDSLPVIIVGDGAGFVYSTLGFSHQCLEDIAALRAIPNINIFSPCDNFEMSAILSRAMGSSFPSYIRMGKSGLKEIRAEAPDIMAQHDFVQIRKGNKKIAFLGTGSLVYQAKEMGDYFDCDVYSCPVIKPLYSDYVIDNFSECKGIVTFEEHNKNAGFGSAIAEIFSQFDPIPVLRIGTNKFSKECGTYEYLLKEHKLDEYSLKIKIDNFIQCYQL